MKVTVHVRHTIANVTRSARQVEDVLGHAVALMAEALPGFRGFDVLAINLSLMLVLDPGRGGGRHDAETRTFDASGPIDIVAWAEEDWNRRVDAMADGVAKAVRAVHKTRIEPDEREALLAVVEAARDAAKTQPPETLKPVEPIYLVYSEGYAEPSVSFQAQQLFPGIRKVVPITLAEAIAREGEQQGQTAEAPTTFKLYQRVDGRLSYREAWPDGDHVVEHWGVCGERGQTRDHPASDDKAKLRVLKALKAEGRAQGFRPIAPSRHVGLLVEVAIDGFGQPGDIDRRHALEDFLNEVTGWLGLGHCDGGSIGSGAMEAYCLVVDFPVANAAIEVALVGSPFADFKVRRGEV